MARGLIVLVLLLVILGIMPAATSILHCWVALSIATGIGLPDGGEQAAQMASLFFVFLCLPDWRVCAWINRGTVLRRDATLGGITVGALWALRFQMAFIYAESGISKLTVDDWLNGSALYYVVRDPSFGSTGPVGVVLREITSLPLGVAVLTWGTIALEVCVALLLLFGGRRRRLALYAVLALHVGIILSIGLWSFALAMIAGVFVASLKTTALYPDKRELRAGGRNGESLRF